MPLNEIILHVENDADDVFLLQRAFKKAGVTQEIKAAENGRHAVQYLEGTEAFADRAQYPLPTVILLDWNMPLMSGGDFLKWIRSEKKWQRLPVIVLTSSASERDMGEAYDLGANGFLVKPNALDNYVPMAQSFAQYWLEWNRSPFRKLIGS